jgi:hypothetical protein
MNQKTTSLNAFDLGGAQHELINHWSLNIRREGLKRHNRGDGVTPCCVGSFWHRATSVLVLIMIFTLTSHFLDLEILWPRRPGCSLIIPRRCREVGSLHAGCMHSDTIQDFYLY